MRSPSSGHLSSAYSMLCMKPKIERRVFDEALKEGKSEQ